MARKLIIDGKEIEAEDNLTLLQACEQALRNGVSRVRIMPSVEASVLPGFYQHKIDLGTEVLAQ